LQFIAQIGLEVKNLRKEQDKCASCSLTFAPTVTCRDRDVLGAVPMFDSRGFSAASLAESLDNHRYAS
jgi:hypothetical protein